MKKTYSFVLKNFSLILIFLFVHNVNAQIGIGTTAPAASSILDVTSTTKGMLTPRMTSAQKLAIASPANGLMVFDTTLKMFSYYDSIALSWVSINAGRSSFKRIKSTDNLGVVLAAELAAGGGAKYLMDPSTLYEINGSIMLNLPIEINNSYISGSDTNEDKLIKVAGDLFTGTTGGSVKLLTLVASTGNVFNINGGGTETLVFRDLIIASSANVGVLQDFSLVFGSLVQFAGNTNGIVYRDISRLLLDNQGWFGNNGGICEKYEGAFSSLQKQGGFLEVNGTAIGVDFSSNPTLALNGTMIGVNFTGVPTTGKYVNPYTIGAYPGFSFTKDWDVNCSGIPFEGDSFTVGDVNMDLAVGFGFPTTLSGTPTKVLGTTTSNNMFRASVGGTNNRITYLGNKKRFFTVNAAGSIQGSNGANTIYIFYIAKNGVVVNQSKTYVFSTNTTDLRSFPIQSIVELSPNDYVEVYAMRLSGTSDILTVSLNLFMK